MSKLLLTFTNAALYSSTLSATIYLNKDNNNGWNLNHCAYLGLFWVGFMVPTGVIWGITNKIAQNALQLPKKYKSINVLSLNYYQNKKALFTDVILNHFIYGSITVFGAYSYFNQIKPEIYNSYKSFDFIEKQENHQKQSETQIQENSNNSQITENKEIQQEETIDIIKKNGLELFQSRYKITILSILWDIWFPQYILKKQKNDSLFMPKPYLRIHRFKEIMFLLFWHQSLIAIYMKYQQNKNQQQQQSQQNKNQSDQTQQ